jgi:hypothetical protein
LRIILTLFLLASTLSASPVVKTFFDKDFGLFESVPTWDSSIITQFPSSSGLASSRFGGKPTAGEITAISRVFEISLPTLAPGATGGIVLGQINNTFSWDPTIDGAIGLMEFSFDLQAMESGGFSTSLGIVGAFFRPILLQNGIIYRASTAISSAQPSNNGSWSVNPFSFTFTSLADWTRSGVSPNLGATGAPIQFGFEAGLLGSCSSASTTNCGSAFSVSALDNFFVRVTSASTQEPPDPAAIPEPSTILLLSGGLGLLLFRHRRRA